jgi:hypothetical protein
VLVKPLRRHLVHGAALAFGSFVVITSTGCATGGGMGQVTTAHDSADRGGLASSLDAPLAVGAEVRPALKFELPGSAAPSVQLVSPRSDVLEVQGGLLVGKSAGLAPVLVAVDGGTVIDFVHVTVRQAERIEVHGFDAAGVDVGPLSEVVELVAGDGIRLSPRPYAGTERLAGVATSTWVVDPPIALVLREGLPNRVRLVARQPGTATVKVTMLGVTSSIELRVVS